jgi:lipid-A-disaccharide synthase
MPMLDKNKKYRIFISAAEPSADAHCAGLITSLKNSGYDIEFVGVGGPKMAEAGCELLEATVGKAVMIYKAFRHVGRYYKLIKRLTGFIRNNKINLVIVCDSPAFNFHIAKAAKRAGVKTLFYVAPQLWAWASWRIYKLRKYCDKLCCILPFEQEWFGKRGMDVVFVGNPLLDGLEISTDYCKRYVDFKPEKARFALMPGSRTAEIESLWGPMQQISLRLKEKYPAAEFITVAVDNEREQLLKRMQIPGFESEYNIGSVRDTAGSVDFTIVTSGSATLEVTAAGCPMVIMYQSSRILWKIIGCWLIRTKYLSLVNILAQKELVPEFMPYFTSIGPIVDSIERLLQDEGKLTRMSEELIRLAQPLAVKKASKEVAMLVLEMLN